jgi:hypothetical protein
MTDPKYDLEGFIREQNESGDAERDPYGYAINVIATTLEWALDDGIRGAMNDHEFALLNQLAGTITSNDPATTIETMGE